MPPAAVPPPRLRYHGVAGRTAEPWSVRCPNTTSGLRRWPRTRPSPDASVEDYIVSRANEQQHSDCRELMALLEKITRQPPKMWGPSIVGYGFYRYTYESGRTGEAPLSGFAIRGRELVVYLLAEGDRQKSLLSRLGKHKMGKACLYFQATGRSRQVGARATCRQLDRRGKAALRVAQHTPDSAASHLLRASLSRSAARSCGRRVRRITRASSQAASDHAQSQGRRYDA